MGLRWDSIPAEIFVGILHRVPPSPRRRLRLVCRHWRNVIDDRTPHPQAHAKVLAFVSGHVGCQAYVFDDLTEASRAGGRYLELRRGVGDWGSIMVGTCNGLLCIHRCTGFGDVVVVNPVTGEKLAVPPPSKTIRRAFAPPPASYGFAYHPATGLYKVVHLPCDEVNGGTFGAVSMFTMGDTSWRDVPVAGGSSCLLSFGLASAGGTVYWVASDACSVMSFDVMDERVEFVTTLPVQVGPRTCLSSWHLTADARGRLGLVVCSDDQKRGSKSELWMLEGGGRHTKAAWVLRCKIEEPVHKPLQQLALPLVTHGEHILTTRARGRSLSLHAHSLSEAKTHDDVVRMERTASPPVGLYDNCSGIQTFAYVETTEPLALYAYHDGEVGKNENWDWLFDIRERRWELEPRRSWLYDLPIN